MSFILHKLAGRTIALVQACGHEETFRSPWKVPSDFFIYMTKTMVLFRVSLEFLHLCVTCLTTKSAVPLLAHASRGSTLADSIAKHIARTNSKKKMDSYETVKHSHCIIIGPYRRSPRLDNRLGMHWTRASGTWSWEAAGPGHDHIRRTVSLPSYKCTSRSRRS